MPSSKAVIPPSNPAKPPEVPSWLPDDSHDEWALLWTTGISTMWRVDQHDAVGRLAQLRVRFRECVDLNADLLARMHVQITRLEQMLLLSLESQVRAGVIVEEPRPTDLAEERERRRESLNARMASAN
jgi:hypothetical protein